MHPALLTLVTIALLGAASAQGAPDALSRTAVDPGARFVPNAGQWDDDAVFRIRRGAATAWLSASGMRLDLHHRIEEPAPPPGDGPGRILVGAPARMARASVRLAFEGAHPVVPVAGAPTPTTESFVLGNDPSRWRHDLPTYGAVTWDGLLPGLKLHARTHAAGLLEYVIECAPGRDPAALVLRWEGAAETVFLPDGGIRLAAAESELLQSAPIAWQPLRDGSRCPLAVRTERLEDGRFRFRVADADPELPIVVDPVLRYLGQADASLHGVAHREGPTFWAAGYTGMGTNTSRDAVVAWCDSRTNTVLSVATFGGADEDVAFDVTLAPLPLGVTVVGYTVSPDFPVRNAAQASHGGGTLDGFLLHWLPAVPPGGSSVLQTATYLGGSGDDWACRVAVDPQLQTTIAGCTDSTDFPVTANALQPALAGGIDAFVTREPVGGGGWSYSTYHGGSFGDGFLWPNWTAIPPMNIRYIGLDVDDSGRVLLSGRTQSGNYPLQNPTQPGLAGQWDAYATILDPNATGPAQRVWSTCFGGSLQDGAFACAFAPGGLVVLAGHSDSANLPRSPGALQTAFGGVSDAMLAWFDPSATGPAQLVYGTYLGGSGGDVAWALAVDSRGHATVGGHGRLGLPNGGWPADAGGHQLILGGGIDAWVARVRPERRGRQDLTYGTYLGGTGSDLCADLELQPDGGVALAGATESPTIPLVTGVLTGAVDGLLGTLEVLPVGFTRDIACSAPGCAATLMLELDRRPSAGGSFEFLVGAAPPQSFGALVFGAPQTCALLPAGGLLGVTPLAQSPLLLSSTAGAASLTMSLPPGFGPPFGIGIQALWLDTTGCAPPFLIATSAVLQ